jgi:conjugal transfer/type IV secretion protein DotA/TraY
MAGLTLAYVVPMIPYIIYTMAVLGWIMAVMVALIGAPLWAAVHAIPTGEGAIPQEAKQGWKMLLALFVEPALLVFGFFLSIVVFQAAAWLVDKTFTATAESVLTMGGTSGIGAALAGIFGSITLILIFVVLYWKIALWSFSLIMVIPNKALEWGGMQALSDYGQRNVHAEVIAGVANVHREAIKKPQQKNGNKNNNNSDTED